MTLAREGAAIVVTDLNAATAEETAAMIQAAGGREGASTVAQRARAISRAGQNRRPGNAPVLTTSGPANAASIVQRHFGTLNCT